MKTLATLAAVAGLCLLSGIADGANTCVTNCTGTTGGGKTCFVYLINPNFFGCTFPGGHGTLAHATLNASCLIGTAGDLKATAIHTVGQGSSARCEFSFGFWCYFPSGPVNLQDCTVDTAGDSLPVELMAFSVE